MPVASHLLEWEPSMQLISSGTSTGIANRAVTHSPRIRSASRTRSDGRSDGKFARVTEIGAWLVQPLH